MRNKQESGTILVKQGKYKNSSRFSVYLIKRFLRVIVRNLKGRRYNRLLDLGCGEGVPLVSIAPSLQGLRKIHGLDLDEDKISMIRNNVPDGEFIKGSIYHLPYKNSEFDLVLCLEIFEHLRYPENAMEEIKRIASNDILFSIPNEPIWSILNLLRLKYLRNLGNTPNHCQKWTPREFENLVKKFYTVKSVENVLPWTIVYCSVQDS
ncbi:MAG: class I SAM-dependent methyltransferase [Deltaproteobacteria bacterium]|nr:class I SAM-dependent methyltransferase [Deltaproteobacteria bacterium]